MPMFPSVLLMAQMTGVSLPTYMAGMLIPSIVFGIIGYLPYLRKIPRQPVSPPGTSRMRSLLELFQHLWSILLILFLMIAFQMPIVAAILISIVLCIFVYRFKPAELIPMIKKAFETQMMVNCFLVLILSQFIAFTGVLAEIPDALSVLPVPPYVIFFLVFFLGCLVGGSVGIIAMGAPLAFAAIPDAGMPLMVLLMCAQFAASQVQPTHICLVMIADYYHISLGALIRKSMVWVLLFVAFSLLYYNGLLLLAL